MELNSKNNQFIVLFPDDFWDEKTLQLYDTHYKNLMLPYKNISDFIASTIKKIDFPGFGIDTKKQVGNESREAEWKGAMPLDNLLKKELTITFKMTEGFFNYMIMHNNFMNWLSFENPSQSHSKMFIGCIDNDGYLLWYYYFDYILPTSISDFSLDYTKANNEQDTFRMNFKFNLWYPHYVVGEPVNLIKNT